MRCVVAWILTCAAVQAEVFSADVWVDNWFSMAVNGVQVAEDSVSITTERSFNAESFSFTAERPFVIAITAKDFKENDTGLEYIGSRRQQMGDGGLIAQVISANASIVTNKGWRCLVVHQAPIDTSCANERSPVAGQGACGFRRLDHPKGWDQLGFDDSAWPQATEWSARAVRPKGGYDRIQWNAEARLIWSEDLETDNTLLCRTVVN